jgi:hypothetical protein
VEQYGHGEEATAMRKMMFLTGAAAGYVLGARAGRERYEQICRLADRIMSNPTVQNATGTAMSRGNEMAHKVADTAAEKAPGWMPGSRSGSDSDMRASTLSNTGMPATLGGMSDGRRH